MYFLDATLSVLLLGRKPCSALHCTATVGLSVKNTLSNASRLWFAFCGPQIYGFTLSLRANCIDRCIKAHLYPLYTVYICGVVSCGPEEHRKKKDNKRSHMGRRYKHMICTGRCAHTWTNVSCPWPSITVDTLLTMIALVGISIAKIALYLHTQTNLHMQMHTHTHACLLCSIVDFKCWAAICHALRGNKFTSSLPSDCFNLNGIHLRGTHSGIAKDAVWQNPRAQTWTA